MATTEGRSIQGMAQRANPAFAAAVVAVPILAFAGALAAGDTRGLTYVHVMSGVLWTGIDVFMGLVLGPVLGGLSVEDRAAVFRRFTPKMTFLMPVLALVTIASGIVLAVDLGYFVHPQPWLAIFSTAVTLPAVTLIAAQFGALTKRRSLAVLGVLGVAHAGWLAVTLPEFAMTAPAVVAALAIVTLLSVIGFGVVLPGEVRMYLEMVSEDPDEELIGEIGLRNAKLGGVQGALQLSIVVVMVLMRWGVGVAP